MVEFAYKLPLHYNIDILVFPIWMLKIIKVSENSIPLGSCKLYYMQKETYHENQQNEIFKIKDVQNIL